MNDKLQSPSTYSPAIREPRIFPIEVCEFQRPNIMPTRHKKEFYWITDWNFMVFNNSYVFPGYNVPVIFKQKGVVSKCASYMMNICEDKFLPFKNTENKYRWRASNICELGGFHSSEDGNAVLPGWDTLQTHKWIQAFQSNTVSSSSGLKYWYLPISLRDITTQNIISH
jgi:hypothetical protein